MPRNGLSPVAAIRHPSNGIHHARTGAGSSIGTMMLVRFSQTIMFLLGLTYTFVVLLPLVRHEHALITSASIPNSSNGMAAASALADWSSKLLLQAPLPTNDTNSLGNVNNNVDEEDRPIQLEQKDRIITLVHVGKAGGVSLRRLTVIFCKLFFRKKRWADTREERIKACIEKHFPDSRTILSHQTQHYFHIEEYDVEAMEASTSFLVTLRNPVDRIISTYRYSHPGNCNDDNRDQVWRPRGCEAEKHKNKTGLIQNDIHFKCFKSPAMEDFAQALMKPWKQSSFWSDLSLKERRHCRYLAREMVQGYGTYGSAPHMLYNYFYYAQRSIWKYPEKEVFAIRTEHEWDDTVALDHLLGGNANFVQNRDVSHGSEGYAPSPLSTQAYQKLCCALESEIEIYQDILERAINLDFRAKEEDLDSIREKCGIQTTWTEWRIDCRRHLRKDLRALHPSLIVNETKYLNMKVGYDHPPPSRLFSRYRTGLA